MFIAIGYITIPILIFLYRHINAKRDKEVEEAKANGIVKYTPDELRKMGDRAPDFRYIL
jgi:hypothetical protein